MLFLKLLVRTLACVAAVLAIDITSPRIDRGVVNLSIGDITIESGAYWSIVDNAVSVLAGDLDVKDDAGFYITSTQSLIGLSVTLASGLGSITNDGIIAFNSVVSLVAPNYNLIGLSFTNNGEMYLGTNGSVVGAPPINLVAPSWTNTGLLVIYSQTRSADGIVNLGGTGLVIQNNGQICLTNELYQASTQIRGTGCITANVDSTVFLANGLLGVDQSQTFYLADSRSSIRANAVAVPQTFTIAGFGNGNIIGLDIPLATVFPLSSWSYTSSTGILTLRGLGLLSQNFNIGPGYNSNLFSITTDSSLGLASVPLGGLTYSGPVPNAIPSNCQPCKNLPSAPGTSASVTSTSFTSTKSDGSICTDVDQILISTDAQGSWFTSTSLVSEVCSTIPNSQTTETSTWTGTTTK
ncbi:hyphally regulated cell wall protein, partial [Scheffersomyces stipitis CBS 6054]